MKKHSEKIIKINGENKGLVQRFLDGLPNQNFKIGDGGEGDKRVRKYGNISLVEEPIQAKNLSVYENYKNMIKGNPAQSHGLYLSIKGGIKEELEEILKYIATTEGISEFNVDNLLKNYNTGEA